MQCVFHPANERGSMSLDWLEARYSFSFAQWYNPTKMGWGALRVLNNDTIAPRGGFDFHEHRNMEIVTIILKGCLTHRDSLGNTATIKEGEIQLMSAGTGIVHSEINASLSEQVELFQLWIIPKLYDIPPRYDQMCINYNEYQNTWKTFIAPYGNDVLHINQDAYLSLGRFDAKTTTQYKLKHSGNILYIMQVDGLSYIETHKLSRRDALGITDIDTSLTIQSAETSTILAIEVPPLSL